MGICGIILEASFGLAQVCWQEMSIKGKGIDDNINGNLHKLTIGRRVSHSNFYNRAGVDH